jgi:H+-transporting ATPase
MNGAVALSIVGFACATASPIGNLVRLALIALLGTIPVALPATFTLSAAFSAQMCPAWRLTDAPHSLVRGGGNGRLCADTKGTLTRQLS